MAVLLPSLELVYRDASGSHAAVEIRLKSGTTYAAADAGAISLASALASLTEAVLVRQRIRYRVVTDEITTAELGSSIKRCGVFIWACIDDEHQALVSLPSIVESVIVTTEPGAGVLIDTSDALVIAFTDELIAQGVTDPFANEISSLIAAYRQSRV